MRPLTLADLEERADIVLLCISPDDSSFYRRGLAADVTGDPFERENYAWRRRFEAQIIRNVRTASCIPPIPSKSSC